MDIIEKLAKKLRGNRSLYDVIPICTAKVPIVKFKHRRAQLEGDISLYNTLVRYIVLHIEWYSYPWFEFINVKTEEYFFLVIF